MDQPKPRQPYEGLFWVQSHRRSGTELQIDGSRGRVVRKRRASDQRDAFIGVGRRYPHRTVALIVSTGEPPSIWLLAGRRRFVLDGETTARHRTVLCGLFSRLTVQRAGQRPLRLAECLIGDVIASIVDSAFDDLDRTDFLETIARVASRADSRTWMLDNRDGSGS